MSDGTNADAERTVKGDIEAADQSTTDDALPQIRDRHRQPGEEIALIETGDQGQLLQMIEEGAGQTEIESVIAGGGILHLQAPDLLRLIEDASHLIDAGHIQPRRKTETGEKMETEERIEIGERMETGEKMETGEVVMTDTTDMIIDETRVTDGETIGGHSENPRRTEKQNGRGN